MDRRDDFATAQAPLEDHGQDASDQASFGISANRMLVTDAEGAHFRDRRTVIVELQAETIAHFSGTDESVDRFIAERRIAATLKA